MLSDLCSDLIFLGLKIFCFVVIFPIFALVTCFVKAWLERERVFNYLKGYLYER